MGFFKTAAAVTAGVLGAFGLIALGQTLSEKGYTDKAKKTCTSVAEKAASRFSKKDEAAEQSAETTSAE